MAASIDPRRLISEAMVWNPTPKAWCESGTIVGSERMLKIGTVKWRGKCSKHPGYDPSSDGIGAIKGNCARCNELAEIFDYHEKARRLMRKFQVPAEKTKAVPEVIDLQQNLFD